MKVYLAGGFKTGWQDTVKEACKHHEGIEFFDPRDHKIHDPVLYTKQDLAAIDECDVVLGYMESDNPGESNFAFELGYAHARGKLVMMVNEKGMKRREMLHVTSKVFNNIEEAAQRLPNIMRFNHGT